MKNKLFVGLCLFCILLFFGLKGAHAAVTFEQAKAVFSKLQNAAGTHVILKKDDSWDQEAWTSPYSITITQGLLYFCDNVDQVAWVLGHEMGHYVKKDSMKYESKEQELAADVYGAKLARKAGFKNGISFLYKTRKEYGEEGKDGVHPTWSDRIKNIQRST